MEDGYYCYCYFNYNYETIKFTLHYDEREETILLFNEIKKISHHTSLEQIKELLSLISSLDSISDLLIVVYYDSNKLVYKQMDDLNFNIDKQTSENYNTYPLFTNNINFVNIVLTNKYYLSSIILEDYRVLYRYSEVYYLPNEKLQMEPIYARIYYPPYNGRVNY